MVTIQQAFKETMDSFKIQNRKLAEAAGKSERHLSGVRSGRANTTIWELEKYLELCEEMAPGFRREFGRRVAGADFFCVSAVEAVDQMNEEELSNLIFAISEKVRGNKKSNNREIELVRG
jgi:hypothetical protein